MHSYCLGLTSRLEFVVCTDLVQDFLILGEFRDFYVYAGSERGSQVGGTEGKVTMAFTVGEGQLLL